MNTQFVEDAVLVALATRLDVDRAAIDLDVPLHLLPKIESVLMLNVMVDLESSLGVVIPDDIPFEAVTARDLARLIQELL